MHDDDYPYEPQYEDDSAPHRTKDRDYQREEPDRAPEPRMGFESKAIQAQATIGDDLWELHAASARLLDFTAGRTQAEFASSDLLQAAAELLLPLTGAAVTRIAAQSAEISARLEGVPALQTALAEPPPTRAAALWIFIDTHLQALHSSAAAELETWHSG